MRRSISSGVLTVTVQRLGAELCSIKSAGGTEYIWQANPHIWGRHAPVLFPIVGKLAHNAYEFNGTRFQLGQHGFARDMDFELIDEKADALSFRLSATPATRRCYPFEFVLEVSYTLIENTLEVRYTVSNAGQVTMPFSIGAHPAFALTWDREDRIEDYYLEFEQAETADTRHLDSNGLLSDETERALNNDKILPLRENMFDRDALILLDLESEKVSLRSKRHPDSVTVEFKGFPYLGIWAKPAAPYVCIEPWHGHVDPADHDGLIVNKPGIIQLEPGANFSCVHKIRIDSAPNEGGS